MSDNNFQKLYEIDVNHKTENKNGLKYLSWAFAWAEFKKVYPEATYSVDHYSGKPYLHDEILGYMVSTVVIVNGLSLPMQLPVMDNKNKAMKSIPYQYKTRSGMKDVEAATMFDINTAIMRCLVKNLAMHGLGLYIYAGEDIPSIDYSAEIEAAIEVINQAIKNSDTDYVRDNWQGVIANVWGSLTQQQSESLNLLYNGG
tara:strand:+ start:42 stop:641 length:600 start_codon:yes stop_codon:yes gene_type:complete